MAFSREIIKKVLQYVQFRVPVTEEKDSYYTQIGDTLVRLSNHCTRLYIWDDILEKNPKWKGLPIVSIVFEDTEVTFNEVECLTLKRVRKKPIKVNEYVYNLQGNPQFLTPQYEKLIIQSIKNINEGQYKDTTNKCSPPQVRISRNPINENKEYKTNINMAKKQVIRLTEGDLHRIIKESVNRILNEHDLMFDDNNGYFNTSEYMNSQQNTWRGVPNTKVIWHGESSDYEVVYQGEVLNGNELDNYAWDAFQDTYKDVDIDEDTLEEEFDVQPVEWFKKIIDEFSENYWQ